MPRTKVRRQNTVKSRLEDEDAHGVKKRLADIRKEILDAIELERTRAHEEYAIKCLEDKAKIPPKYLSMTMSALKNVKSFSSLSSTTYLSVESVADLTKSVRNTTKKTGKRSLSYAGDDEGYLTTESTNSGPRTSRSRMKKAQPKTRVTRSLSRKNAIEPPQPASEINTPLNKQTPPNTYGLITPKVKPNTPLVLLRRPKMGEVALSMQGSPLLTAPIATDEAANINIPLVDGTLLSLQPQRGLRKSQIPDLDPVVKKQLQMLRDNLNIFV